MAEQRYAALKHVNAGAGAVIGFEMLYRKEDGRGRSRLKINRRGRSKRTVGQLDGMPIGRHLRTTTKPTGTPADTSQPDRPQPRVENMEADEVVRRATITGEGQADAC